MTLHDTRVSKSMSEMHSSLEGASQGVSAVKNPPADAGDVRDTGLISGSGSSPGGGHGNPHQGSCLENPMN